MHVIERFKLVEDGKILQVSVTVDDPGGAGGDGHVFGESVLFDQSG